MTDRVTHDAIVIMQVMHDEFVIYVFHRVRELIIRINFDRRTISSRESESTSPKLITAQTARGPHKTIIISELSVLDKITNSMNNV